MIQNKKILFLAVFSAFLNFYGKAQPQSLYHFGSITQRYYLNPAFQPWCNVYVGMPGINSLYIAGGNNAVSLNNFIYLEGSKMTTIFDSGVSKTPLINAFKPANIIFSNISLGIIDFGFRFGKDFYFTYDLSLKENISFGFPKEFAQLLIEGNAPGTSDGMVIPLKHFGFREEAYLEHAFGLSKEISPELTIGGRLKIIHGLFNITTNTNKASLQAYDSSWYYNKPMYAYASVPVAGAWVKDMSGGVSLTQEFEDNPEKYLQDHLTAGSLFKNMGLGMDLGMDYRPSDLWSLSASIVDLGFIHWNNTTSARMTTRQDSAFKGVYLTPEIVDDARGRALIARATLDTLRDLLLNQFQKNSGELQGYTTFLTWKFYAGASYFLWPEKLSIGLLSRTEMYYKHVYERITVSANFFPARFWSATASYTFLNNTFSNMGIGMNFKLGPLNLYLIGDYWPLVYGKQFIPYQSRMINAQLGMNLLFGCGKRIKDRPMISAY